MIAALAAILEPEREIVIARELTKRFESLHRSSVVDAPAWIDADPDRQRGEFVLIIEAPHATDAQLQAQAQAVSDDALLVPLLAELPLAQAVRIAVAQSGAPKNRLYQRALALKKPL